MVWGLRLLGGGGGFVRVEGLGFRVTLGIQTKLQNLREGLQPASVARPFSEDAEVLSSNPTAPKRP